MTHTHNPPPFRAEQIGSLLRPRKLLDARNAFDQGKLTTAELASIEDACIKEAVSKLRASGIKSITDGEYRRHMFFDGFHDHLEGFVKVDDPPIDIFMTYVPDIRGFVNSPAKKPADTWICKGKIKRKQGVDSPYVKQFKFLATFLPKEEIPYAKMTLAAPEWYHLRHSSKYAFTPEAYTREEDYFHDIAVAYQEELQALYDAGCRSVQFDDPLLAYFASEQMLGDMKAVGIDPSEELQKYVSLYKEVLGKRPKDLKVGLHLCRGNFIGGIHFSEGGYEHIATELFRQIDVDYYLLEYDTPRAGGFEPLAELPKEKSVVLGIFSSKRGAVEDKQAMIAKVHQAAKIMAKGSGQTEEEALQRISISPQCGFASHSEGNNVQMDEMWNKFKLAREIAGEIWPGQP